ncbi:chorismate mutase [Vagococcus coleopterorum]|uniref:Chorismate mutase n=1 Tax=Vagococcus coleopterorum TaxID=2714946 RepID=A0A6G8AM65_9ENTE|nr:chorismate mutase [Vagococcus coleopterorum]QIL46042.1 chorismate mutase [Vagococcus coleopterorum]
MLKNQRDKIDKIDKQIVSLIEDRLQVVKEVAIIKKENGIPVLDSSREENLLTKVKSYTDDADLKKLYEEIFSTIMNHSKEQQNKLIEK